MAARGWLRTFEFVSPKDSLPSKRSFAGLEGVLGQAWWRQADRSWLPTRCWARPIRHPPRVGPQLAHSDAPAAQHNLAGGAAAGHRMPPGIRHALGAAQRNTVSLYQGGQHPLARIAAQAQKEVAHVAQNALHRQPGTEIYAGATSSAQSTGFVRNFISVVPFFAG